MLDFIKTFRADEDGAVTVDWVVLTAAIVGLGIAVIVAVRSGTVEMGEQIGGSLTQTASSIQTYNAVTGVAGAVQQ